jgi:hypothetical protein
MDQRIARVYLHKLSEIKSFPTDIDKDFIDNLINSVLPIGILLLL